MSIPRARSGFRSKRCFPKTMVEEALPLVDGRRNEMPRVVGVTNPAPIVQSVRVLIGPSDPVPIGPSERTDRSEAIVLTEVPIDLIEAGIAVTEAVVAAASVGCAMITAATDPNAAMIVWVRIAVGIETAVRVMIATTEAVVVIITELRKLDEIIEIATGAQLPIAIEVQAETATIEARQWIVTEVEIEIVARVAGAIGIVVNRRAGLIPPLGAVAAVVIAVDVGDMDAIETIAGILVALATEDRIGIEVLVGDPSVLVQSVRSAIVTNMPEIVSIGTKVRFLTMKINVSDLPQPGASGCGGVSYLEERLQVAHSS